MFCWHLRSFIPVLAHGKAQSTAREVANKHLPKTNDDLSIHLIIIVASRIDLASRFCGSEYARLVVFEPLGVEEACGQKTTTKCYEKSHTDKMLVEGVHFGEFQLKRAHRVHNKGVFCLHEPLHQYGHLHVLLTNSAFFARIKCSIVPL